MLEPCDANYHARLLEGWAEPQGRPATRHVSESFAHHLSAFSENFGAIGFMTRVASKWVIA
jgi:hypothetical protein